MTSPDDLTPTTPEPLSEHRKQLLRDELLAAAQGRSSRPERRWLMPGLAAAAVLAIVAVGAIVGQDGGGDGSAGLPGPLTPAGGGSSAIPGQTKAHPTTVPHPAKLPTSPHVVKRGHHVITGLGQAEDGTTTCEQEIAALVDLGEHPGLDGATVTADRSSDDYTTSLYETKTAWIVCDDFAAADGGAPTLLAVHDKSDPYLPDASTLGISENFLFSGESQYFAAGRDFDGVQSIAYAFPDGHTEDAVVGQNGLWSMTYLPTSGPLADLDVNQTTLDPIQVTVDYTDGHTDTFVLDWGPGTCGQINHGC